MSILEKTDRFLLKLVGPLFENMSEKSSRRLRYTELLLVAIMGTLLLAKSCGD